MKCFILKTLIIYFFVSGFSNVFSQEEKLEVYFDINEDGSAISNKGSILVEYNIKNEKDEIIGRVILDSDMDEFQYFNIKNEIVAYRWNFNNNNSSPFDNKKMISFIRDKKSEDFIFKQKWNQETDRFDLFSKEDQLIGNISLNLKTGLWGLYRIENKYYTDKRIFSNYFKINSTNARNNKISSLRTISGRVFGDNGDPLPGAVVFIDGASRGVKTDFDGNYSINATTGEVLEIYSKGFLPFKKIISSNTNKFSAVLTSKKNKRKKNDSDAPRREDYSSYETWLAFHEKWFQNKYPSGTFSSNNRSTSNSNNRSTSLTKTNKKNDYRETVGKKRNKKLKAKDVSGFGVNVSLTQSSLKSILDGNKTYGELPLKIGRVVTENQKIRFGAEYHDIFGDYNSLGITLGIKKSDTFVSDEYNLSDYDLALTYGFSFLYNLLKFKVGFGYYTYNFNSTESFGDFYDYGSGFYYSAGLQLYIPMGNSGITLDGFYNNDGLGYGLGFKF